jgi:hypothetical protein
MVIGLTPGQFITSQWSTWQTNNQMKVLAGDFNGDGKTDVMKFDVPAAGTAALGLWVGRSELAWSLWNRYAALEANSTYDISFDTQHVSGPLNIDQFMKVQNLSGVTAAQTQWRFTQPIERRTITPQATIGSESGNGLVFGAGGVSSYLVDNIRVIKRSP